MSTIGNTFKKREKIHPHHFRLLYLLRGAGIQGGKKMNRALQPHEEYLRALLRRMGARFVKYWGGEVRPKEDKRSSWWFFPRIETVKEGSGQNPSKKIRWSKEWAKKKGKKLNRLPKS